MANFFKDVGDFLHDAVEDVGDFIPGVGDARAAEKANKQNAVNAKAQMDFQERMSNSAYQRSMEDMKKAGLNPMLAMSQGGASTPSGAMATVSPVTKTKLAEFGLNAAQGIGGLSNQKTLADNTLQDSISNRNFQQASTAKTVAETQDKLQDIEIKKRDLPNAQAKEKYTRQGYQILDKVLNNLSNSAKNTMNLFNGKANVKVLGPGPKIPWSKNNSKKGN